MDASRLAVAVALAVCLVGCQSAATLSDVAVDPEAITPNRDGDTDVARLSYRVGVPVTLTVALVGPDSAQHVLRADVPRSPGQYEAYFGGVIAERMLPDADYTVRFVAVPRDGSPEVIVTRPLSVRGGDTTPPVLAGLTVRPDTFTPNQDGLGDRVAVSYRLDEPAEVRVWLESVTGAYVTDILEDVESAKSPGEPGPHVYDYDAGVDADAPPPADGDYRIVAEARDLSGNVSRAMVPLHIREGGQPRAALVGDVEWSDTVIPLGATLYFTATVKNVGATPIRTRGPESAFVYDNTQTFNLTAPSEVIVMARSGGAASARHVPILAAAVDGVDLDLASPSGGDAPAAAAPTASRRTGTPPGDATPPADALGVRTRVCGTVRRAGAVVPGAEVIAFEADGDNGVRTTADAGGRYCLVDLPIAPPYQRTFARSPGAVRLALEYDEKRTDIEYPFRWQLGRTEDLAVCSSEGTFYLCLAPGQTVTVTGGVRFVEPPYRRTTTAYLALMHEDVRRMHGPYAPRSITIEY
jgi:hypothetical protein